MNIRTGTRQDFAAVANVSNAAWPDEATNEIALSDAYEKTPNYIKHAYIVAEIAGEVVGFAKYWQFLGMYHPQKFGVTIQVMPQVRNNGIGTLLFHNIVNVLQVFDPISIRISTREDQAAALHLINKWGFSETNRYWESRLNITTPWR
jgi:mycothiol synthase